MNTTHLFHTDTRPADGTPVQTLCGVTVSFDPMAAGMENDCKACDTCLSLRYAGDNWRRRQAFVLLERKE